MTRVRFYHNTEDPLALACELIGKAFAEGRSVALRVPDDETVGLADQMLWRLEHLSFIPHVSVDNRLAGETPVVIGHAGKVSQWPHHDLLFNLADDIAPDFDRFGMVIEIIGRDERQVQPARRRWQHYKSQGLNPKAFDSERREAM